MVDEEQSYSSGEEGQEVTEQVECEDDQCECLTYDDLDGLMIALADLYGGGE